MASNTVNNPRAGALGGQGGYPASQTGGGRADILRGLLQDPRLAMAANFPLGQNSAVAPPLNAPGTDVPPDQNADSTVGAPPPNPEHPPAAEQGSPLQAPPIPQHGTLRYVPGLTPPASGPYGTPGGAGPGGGGSDPNHPAGNSSDPAALAGRPSPFEQAALDALSGQGGPVENYAEPPILPQYGGDENAFRSYYGMGPAPAAAGGDPAHTTAPGRSLGIAPGGAGPTIRNGPAGEPAGADAGRGLAPVPNGGVPPPIPTTPPPAGRGGRTAAPAPTPAAGGERTTGQKPGYLAPGLYSGGVGSPGPLINPNNNAGNRSTVSGGGGPTYINAPPPITVGGSTFIPTFNPNGATGPNPYPWAAGNNGPTVGSGNVPPPYSGPAPGPGQLPGNAAPGGGQNLAQIIPGGNIIPGQNGNPDTRVSMPRGVAQVSNPPAYAGPAPTAGVMAPKPTTISEPAPQANAGLDSGAPGGNLGTTGGVGAATAPVNRGINPNDDWRRRMR